MKKTTLALLVLISAMMNQSLLAQDPQWQEVSLANLDAFNKPAKNWSIVSDGSINFRDSGAITPIAGTGVIINTISAGNNSHLITNAQFGDMELELEFMMVKNSNSGVYLQGRYEVQLYDSWTKLNPGYIDCGGIYQRWNDAAVGVHPGYEGIAPLMNVAKAPGLWQKLAIKFHAPKFNSKGVKIANAYFESVYLNGVLVQEYASVTGPTRSSYFNDEKMQGPLMIQGDHGNVAFRHIRYRELTEPVKKRNPGVTPIEINADSKPIMLRSFLNYGGKKLTHIISVGYPNQVNYSYNLKQGSIIQVWRGQFMDATDMWHERGEPQLATPLGAVVTLSNAPALSILSAKDTDWPDSIAFDAFHNMGYRLDSSRFATFEYSVGSLHVLDKISTPQATGFKREISVTDAPADLFCRIAVSNKIQDLGNGLYAVDDKLYYVQIGEMAKASVRQTSRGAELLLPVRNGVTTSYSLIW